MAVDKIEIQQCKIQTVHHFLERNDRIIDENIIFLLGIDEFLQFGLEKYKQQLFWFMVPYNENNLNEIFNMLEIKETYLSEYSMEQIKKMILENQDICMYFDFESRKIVKKEKKKHNINNKTILSNIGNNSFGMIKDFDDHAFILNIIDLDNKNIRIPFEIYIQKSMNRSTVRLEVLKSNFFREIDLQQRVINKLEHACNIYLNEQVNYEYDEENGKYGVSGYSSLIALTEEIRNLVFQAEQSGDKKFKEILKARLNIMRLYMVKGSETAYRYEIGYAIIYLSKFCMSFKSCGESFIKVGKKWRKFSRVLTYINTYYYYENIKIYLDKINNIISDICVQEFEVVKELKNTIKLFKNNSMKE